ncbi:TrbI F-type domain-containing protein [Sodalis glossinidius]|nr:TrbI F-type domain-containing protein [Sodalis glossinidius]
MSTALRVIPERGVVGLSVRRLALWAVLLSSLLTLWLVPRQLGVVRFDMKQTMAAFYLSAAKQSLTPARSEALSARFNEVLQRDIARRMQASREWEDTQ